MKASLAQRAMFANLFVTMVALCSTLVITMGFYHWADGILDTVGHAFIFVGLLWVVAFCLTWLDDLAVWYGKVVVQPQSRGKAMKAKFCGFKCEAPGCSHYCCGEPDNMGHKCHEHSVHRQQASTKSCTCQLTVNAKDGDDDWHYDRVCHVCGNKWRGLHCEHDGYQNPCPSCGIRPVVVA